MIGGACLCGAVRFEIASGARFKWIACCHCSVCRKQHGALFSTSIGVAVADFRWRSGSAEIAAFRASEAFERPFCRRCGSKLPAASQRPGVMNVPAGTVDGDLGGARPRSHIFVGSKSPLCAIDDALPQHAEYPVEYSVTPATALAPRQLRGAAVLGSCLCNRVGFASEGALERIMHCHCMRCRRSSGSAFKTLSPVALERFRFTRGEGEIVEYAASEAEPYAVRFCARCGSLLPVVLGTPRSAQMVVAAVDTPVAPVSLCHVHVASKAPWHAITDSLPRYAERPPPDACGGACRTH